MEKVVVIELQYPGFNEIEGFTVIIHMRRDLIVNSPL